MKAIFASQQELSARTASLADLQGLMSRSLLTQRQSMSPGRIASYNKNNNPRRLSAVFEVSRKPPKERKRKTFASHGCRSAASLEALLVVSFVWFIGLPRRQALHRGHVKGLICPSSL